MTGEANETTKQPRKTKQVEVTKPDDVAGSDAKQTKEPVPSETSVYIGPSLKTVPQFAVFSNGLSDALKAAKEDCPAIGGLIVPTAKLNEATVALKKAGSKESILFEQAQKFLGSEN